jgi:type II secretory pathway pseudopilin PulG
VAGCRGRNLAEPLLPTSTVRQTLRTDVGFSFVDVIVVTALIATLSAISLPLIQDMANSIALGQARRIVHSELQQARMKSVTSNLVMRVQFNCPAAGQFRMLELLGTPSVPAPQATAANRCSDTAYPFPAADNNPVTLPNQDGPIRRIDPRVSFGAVQTIEFRPTGTAYSVNPDGTSGPPLPGTGVAITLTKGTEVRSVTVNALGKIQ